MLKIKDKIDLRELENYGFEYIENRINNYKAYQKGRLFDQFMCVEPKDRILLIYTSDDRGVDEDTIYDLIKADLIEKVGDEK